MFIADQKKEFKEKAKRKSSWSMTPDRTKLKQVKEDYDE